MTETTAAFGIYRQHLGNLLINSFTRRKPGSETKLQATLPAEEIFARIVPILETQFPQYLEITRALIARDIEERLLDLGIEGVDQVKPMNLEELSRVVRELQHWASHTHSEIQQMRDLCQQVSESMLAITDATPLAQALQTAQGFAQNESATPHVMHNEATQSPTAP